MKTVLVVEDDPINWQVFQKILTKAAGWTAKHTENVEEVLQVAELQEADAILMDVSLSNSYYNGKLVNGFQITQMLKAQPETAGVPVILVTANGSEHDREDFLAQSGADDFIPKPITDRHAFIARIKENFANPS
ncbi:MAG: response regulator [Cyanobacteriota bacterium]|nr:response regulator [Cyanobacteriota bacterium]